MTGIDDILKTLTDDKKTQAQIILKKLDHSISLKGRAEKIKKETTERDWRDILIEVIMDAAIENYDNTETLLRCCEIMCYLDENHQKDKSIQLQAIRMHQSLHREKTISVWESKQKRKEIRKTARFARLERAVGLVSPSANWGSDYPKIRADIKSRDGRDCCVYCFGSDRIGIDHLVPKAIGGTNHIDNLAFACISCNAKKNDRTPTQARMEIRIPTARDAHERYLKKMQDALCNMHMN